MTLDWLKMLTLINYKVWWPALPLSLSCLICKMQIKIHWIAMLKKKLKVILINLLEEGLVEKVSAPSEIANALINHACTLVHPMWDYQFHEGKTLPYFPATQHSHGYKAKSSTGVCHDYKCQLWYQTYQRMKAITWLQYSFFNVPGSWFPHLLNGFNRLTGSLQQLKDLDTWWELHPNWLLWAY